MTRISKSPASDTQAPVFFLPNHPIAPKVKSALMTALKADLTILKKQYGDDQNKLIRDALYELHATVKAYDHAQNYQMAIAYSNLLTEFKHAYCDRGATSTCLKNQQPVQLQVSGNSAATAAAGGGNFSSNKNSKERSGEWESLRIEVNASWQIAAFKNLSPNEMEEIKKLTSNQPKKLFKTIQSINISNDAYKAMTLAQPEIMALKNFLNQKKRSNLSVALIDPININNNLIKKAGNAKHIKLVVAIYERSIVNKEESPVDLDTFINMIEAITQCNDTNYYTNKLTHVCNCAIQSAGNAKRIDLVIEFFKRATAMYLTDITTFQNTIKAITTCDYANYTDEVIDVCNRAIEAASSAKQGSVLLHEVLKLVTQKTLLVSTDMLNNIIAAAGKCGGVQSAALASRLAFNTNDPKTGQMMATIVTMNNLITVLGYADRIDVALDVFNRATAQGRYTKNQYMANTDTFNKMIIAAGNCKRMDVAIDIYNHVTAQGEYTKNQYMANLNTFTCIIRVVDHKNNKNVVTDACNRAIEAARKEERIDVVIDMFNLTVAQSEQRSISRLLDSIETFNSKMITDTFNNMIIAAGNCNRMDVAIDIYNRVTAQGKYTKNQYMANLNTFTYIIRLVDHKNNKNVVTDACNRAIEAACKEKHIDVVIDMFNLAVTQSEQESISRLLDSIETSNSKMMAAGKSKEKKSDAVVALLKQALVKNEQGGISRLLASIKAHNSKMIAAAVSKAEVGDLALVLLKEALAQSKQEGISSSLANIEMLLNNTIIAAGNCKRIDIVMHAYRAATAQGEYKGSPYLANRDTFNNMITALANCGCLSMAITIFNHTITTIDLQTGSPIGDTVTIKNMIKAAVQCNRIDLVKTACKAALPPQSIDDLTGSLTSDLSNEGFIKGLSSIGIFAQNQNSIKPVEVFLSELLPAIMHKK